MGEPRVKRARALLVELVVVFLGVAIALAADSWRESLAEAAREQEYLTSLEAELQEAAAGLRIGVSENERRMEATAQFVALVRSSAEPLDTVEAPGLTIFIPIVPTGTLDALVLSGAFELIEDPELRAALLTERAAVAQWMESAQMLSNTSRSLLGDLIRTEEVAARRHGLPSGRSTAAMVKDTPELIGIYVDHRAALRGLTQSYDRALQAILRLEALLAERE